MANIKSFPNNQDVYIGAENVMKWLHGRTSGVFAADGNASVSALTYPTMAVTVSDGLGWMANAGKDGVVWWIDNEAVNGSKLQLNIDSADGIMNRIDRIIVEWKTTNYVDYPEVKVLKGKISANAIAPALTNDSTVRQISLAMINVAAGTTAITANMITDERLDSSVCGLVTESIRIDTSTMQKQFESLLNSIRMELQDINEGTACLLKGGGTMYGSLDMGNNRILNVSDPVDDSEVANKGFVEDTVENATKNCFIQKLLWQNESPLSEFAGKTVTIDTSAYSYFKVVFTAYAASENDYKLVGECSKEYKGTVNTFFTDFSFFIRTFECTTSGIKFDNAKWVESSGTGTSNKGLIPYRIYGITGVV